MIYLLIAGGLALLFIGGEALVRGSVGIARRFGVSELVIGLTLVGFGTSMPELVTSLRAIETEAVGISVGNVAGSNIANVLLVLGVAAVLRPILTQPSALARDFSIMVVVTVIFGLVAYFDIFSRAAGAGLVGLLVAYLLFSLLMDRRQGAAATLHSDEAEVIETREPLGVSILLTALGMAGVIFGARLLVDGGVQLAALAGLSETVIGLTVVAIGTSLPELATSIVSALRGKSDVALGNIIGSNIFNVLGIVGVTALVHPFTLAGGVQRAENFDYEAALGGPGDALASGAYLTWTDIGAMILSVALLFLFAFTGKKLARWEGAVLLAGYALYMVLVFR
ncbi:MAG: calcium/sodium antiporter [Pseudomonadota bacterium]